MKFQTNTLLPGLSKAGIQRLTTIVDETPDIIAREKKDQNISAGQLWMIHKQRRSFHTRRFIQKIF